MLKRKYINKVLFLIGFLLLIISSLFITINYYQYKKRNVLLKTYFDTPKTISTQDISTNTFIGVLEISKINLKQGFFDVNNINNNVNKNIQLIRGSSMPNKENHLIVLAAHSGNSSISYFKNLNKLSINDLVNIYYQEKKYIYSVKRIEEVLKTGKISIPHGQNNLLVLTTCSKTDKSKQLVITCELKKDYN